MANASASKKVKNMNQAELKVYLQLRGIPINGYLKPALVKIANAVEMMMLPIRPTTTNKD